MSLANFKFPKLDKKGVTLIELILVLGFMAVLSRMMAQIVITSVKSQQRLQAHGSLDNVDSLIRSLLGTATSSSSSSCLTLFKGTGSATAPAISAGVTNLTKFYYPNGSIALEVSKLDPSGLVSITGMTLSPQTGTTCNANSICALVLTVSGTKLGSTSASNTVLKPAVINFSGSIDAQKKLAGCSYQSLNSVPVGNLTIIHSREAKSFTNNYQTPVTVRAIVQSPGGGGSQGGDDCYGSDGGYNGGNGAYFDGEFQLAVGQQIEVEVGTPGQDSWGGPPEWGRDSTIQVFSGAGTLVTSVVILGGRAYSVFRGFDSTRPYAMNTTPVSFVCNTWGSSDPSIQPFSNPCESGDKRTPTSWVQTGSVTRIIKQSNGTMCNLSDRATLTHSWYNQSANFDESLGSYSKAMLTQMFQYGDHGYDSLARRSGYGDGGIAGWSGAYDLQTHGQNGIGLLYIKSAP